MAAPPGSNIGSSSDDTFTVVKTKRDPSSTSMNKVRPRTKDTPEIVFGKVQKWCTIEHEEPGNNNCNQEPKIIYHQVEPLPHQSTSNNNDNNESSSKQEEDEEGDDPQTTEIRQKVAVSKLGQAVEWRQDAVPQSKNKEIDLDDEAEDPRNTVVEIRPTTRIQDNERPAQTTVGAAVDAPAMIEEDEQEA